MEIVDGSPQDVWVPCDGTSTYYVGQLVSFDPANTGGVVSPGAASGVADTSTKSLLYGVIIGTNNRTPVYSSTSNSDSIVAGNTAASQLARDWFGVEGPWGKGDGQAMVKVARINANTRIKARLFNSTIGTAPTVLTVTTGGATTGFTSNACDFTPVANVCTAYCRTGTNAGLYRMTTDTSTTVCTVTRQFLVNVAVGDTFVRVPLKVGGPSYVQTDSNALFFDITASPATNYWLIDVDSLNLTNAGDEHVIFRFAPAHFDLVRA
jgi:hypothetical protein